MNKQILGMVAAGGIAVVGYFNNTLSSFQVNVATDYATKMEVSKGIDRLEQHILRLESKLDQLSFKDD